MSRSSDELRQRTKNYASAIIRLYGALPKRRSEAQVLGRQLLRSGTSVAANFREASRARSVAEFISKLETCIQEADETDLWLELLRDDCGISDERLDDGEKEQSNIKMNDFRASVFRFQFSAFQRF